MHIKKILLFVQFAVYKFIYKLKLLTLYIFGYNIYL